MCNTGNRFPLRLINLRVFSSNECHHLVPTYTLYQRDRPDAPDPLSIFWYNPEVSGKWFVELPLDRSFPDPSGAWVSMRSSWTNRDGLYVAMKAGSAVGHQTRK